MRFAYDFTSLPVLLAAAACLAGVLGFAVILVMQSFARTRAAKRFGEPVLVAGLESWDSGSRRAVKGVLLVLALTMAFVALARPQFRHGTRLIPATNLDVVIVLDYSKSMYARDISPSRIARAKAEVARLIRDLPGARFGAVAFAGEPMSFPLTSDGAAIAKYFQQLDPNDMPVGGTATARALEAARELLSRDPKSKDHVRVIVLVTDGEDLEGDPVQVAQSCAGEGTRIDVVQIGGRAPEVIPEVTADGHVTGFRKDDQGKPLTTELSAEGETQLAKIASSTQGEIVRAQKGETGIDVIARSLAKMMREELSEKVETVFAEEYAWPLGLAVLLLILEASIGEAPRRASARLRAMASGLGGGAAAEAPGEEEGRRPCGARCAAPSRACAAPVRGVACSWDPSRPFEREAPPVKEAIAELDAGDASVAASVLEDYLSTGACKEGSIGLPDSVRRLPNGSFDLGLALFKMGESFGARFGDEELDAGMTDEARQKRAAQIACALEIAQHVASDDAVPLDLRALARYLEGNLDFLGGDYEAAVRAYDESIGLAPGMVDAGDPVGRDAAWNRAIALRRIEDQKDAAPPDGSPGDSGKSPPDGGGGDASKPDGGGGGDSSAPPQPDAGGNDAGEDASQPPPPQQQDAGPPPPPKETQDDRILDQLENAPTVQEEDAKRHAQHRRVRGMEDK